MNLKPLIAVSFNANSESGTGSLTLGAGLSPISATLYPFLRGEQGPSGEPGSAATISTDAGNSLATGSDGGIYVQTNPLETAQW